MKVRPRVLPSGWYPDSAGKTQQKIEEFINKYPDPGIKAFAGIVPHAGWDFSGAIACEVIRCIIPKLDTIIVVGGHLSAGKNLFAASEQGYETPFGILEADCEMLEEMKKEISIKEDNHPDNTVEIQLPFIKYFFPETRVVWMRSAPSPVAAELGSVIYKTAKKMDRQVGVIGSTDLTHYGFNYGFLPKGSGKEAVDWVKKVNDKRIIDAFVSMNPDAAITYARDDRSACSAGGAICAISFAKEKGCKKGKLLRYMTSWDVYPSDSFVGYAGIVFE
jgi:AmmeMemoRadiSam system protein B